MQQHLPEFDHIHPWLNQQPKPKLSAEEADLERLIDVASQLEVASHRSKEDVWQALESQISHSTVRPLISYRALRLAATLVILCGIGFGIFLSNGTQISRIESARAEHKEVLLPDGSTVFLNAASIISYDADSWEEIRSIKLDGEAFFDVKKGKPFEVQTAHAKVSVLGTSFDVYAREKKLKVSVFTGKVVVDIPSSKSFTLTPGQAVKFNEGKATPKLIQNVDLKTAGSWKKGEFHFDSVPLIDVIAEIERQYDVTFEWQGLERRKYDGFFSVDDLNTTLKTTFEPLGISYEMMDNGHILLR